MANVTKPIALDESLNTTENTPRNIADVLASGLSSIANNVKPDGSDISIDVPGMSATNVDDGFSELKGTFAKIQHGSSSSAVSVSPNSFADDTITFPTAFSDTPNVVITPSGSGDNAYRGQVSIFIVSITKTACDIRIFNASAAALSVRYQWIATNL